MERFDHSVKFHTWYEHWHRYHFIKNFVKDKKVCDIACGEGYGSALLSEFTASVIGVDIDSETIANATNKYSNFSNVSYVQSDALNTPFKDNSFDVVVSFETLEHLKEHAQLLEEFKRILTDNGVLIISTPDKDIYSEMDEGHNKYHVKELTCQEFEDLIASKFHFDKTYGQQFQLMSVIEEMSANSDNLKKPFGEALYIEQDKEFDVGANVSPAKYLIKFCSDSKDELNSIKLPNFHSFADIQNSLFKHYEEQINRLMHLDSQQFNLRDTIEKQNAIINHLKARLGF